MYSTKYSSVLNLIYFGQKLFSYSCVIVINVLILYYFDTWHSDRLRCHIFIVVLNVMMLRVIMIIIHSDKCPNAERHSAFRHNAECFSAYRQSLEHFSCVIISRTDKAVILLIVIWLRVILLNVLNLNLPKNATKSLSRMQEE